MNCQNVFSSLLSILLVAHITYVQTAQHCGIKNGRDWYCFDTSLPHCCGFTQNGEALCCANNLDADNPNPTFCGTNNGHRWYCADLTKPRCCGFRDSDGAAMCCPSLFPKSTITPDGPPYPEADPNEYQSDDLNPSANSGDSDETTEENRQNDNYDDPFTTYTYYQRWYLYVGGLLGIFLLGFCIALCRGYCLRQQKKTQPVYTVITETKNQVNTGFENPIYFPKEYSKEQIPELKQED